MKLLIMLCIIQIFSFLIVDAFPQPVDRSNMRFVGCNEVLFTNVTNAGRGTNAFPVSFCKPISTDLPTTIKPRDGSINQNCRYLVHSYMNRGCEEDSLINLINLNSTFQNVTLNQRRSICSFYIDTYGRNVTVIFTNIRKISTTISNLVGNFCSPIPQKSCENFYPTEITIRDAVTQHPIEENSINTKLFSQTGCSYESQITVNGENPSVRHGTELVSITRINPNEVVQVVWIQSLRH